MKFKVTIGVAILGFFIVGMAVKQVAEKKIVSIGNEQALSLEEEEKMSSPEEGDQSWKLLLVNQTHQIPEDYQNQLKKLPNKQAVDKRIYPALNRMFKAAKRQGFYLEVTSSYRTNEEQKEIMAEKVQAFQDQGFSEQEAIETAESWVAVPRTSEHEVGLAVDINAQSKRSTDEEVYAWLAKNAYKYGFILRYPSDKVEITGVSYEPWHYRYVGKKAALEIQKASLTLEEYLAENNN
ncbi:M15 family metallopeptidase [Enterococcus faecalis]|uniref:M15 family metallopeptidase n=1 Tax=Enterococcus faecalis TaxID=1351 RepID=UPI00245502D7|nr:M15 family metallopeptidase [Enterococcus faecalis]EJR6119026.1 M15 family metallopeptidase [Enterococcus faecalis]EJR6119969.1 M15 family metallopeptidase [Enterococcus faecalis]EKB7614927.1 M15 family metallopeptidase [Enterococcus faecalis]EKB7615429.1 M15 family metallopeptidase [Enterococcus faecalis]MDH5046266.1 M15 family metallopeptidase [Enterococcus faecalis]